MDCGCGRSPTGKCIGWHKLSEEEYLEAKKNYQEKDKVKDFIQRTAFFGGFALGSAVTVGIVYSLNQN